MNVRKSILLAALTTTVALLSAVPAFGATSAPAWAINSYASPTDFSTAESFANIYQCDEVSVGGSECDVYRVTASNVGAKAAKSEAVTVEDTLPPGLAVREVLFRWVGTRENPTPREEEDLSRFCTTTPLKCTIPASFFVELGRTVRPDDRLTMFVVVGVEEPFVSGVVTNIAKVHGGGAPAAETTSHNTIEAGPPAFGLSAFSNPANGPEGTPSIQAGAHPYELATKIDMTSVIREDAVGNPFATATEDPRDIVVDLPPGLAGSALSTPETCTLAQLTAKGPVNEQGGSGCPTGSRVGYIRTEPELLRVFGPLFNMVPEQGVVAEFGFIGPLGDTHVLYISLAPTGEGYVLRTTASEITEIGLTDIATDIYGDPYARNGSALEPHVPTLTNPANCDGQPLVTHVHMDSWPKPGSTGADGNPDFSDPRWASATYEAPPVTGCNQLQFEPSIEAKPETNRADSPTGLEVNLKVPQAEGTETLGTPPLKKAVVTLPAGMSVNPSSANGLVGCSLADLGMSASGQPNAAPPHCPDASKIGNVELETPALKGVLSGQIYVARQTENPFHTLLALYIVISDPKTGVIVKLPGEIKADPVTGQLTTVVDNSPQFPFSELRTHFFGGQRAALRTPAVCGTYKVTTQLTPWSAPESGPPATPSSSFKITQSANGGSCPTTAAAQPNAPSFSAGTLSPFAGAYSPFVLHLAREDGSQEFKSLSVALPQGLIGKLAGLSECSEAALASAAAKSGAAEQASPSCPASSELGTVTVGAGAGLTPFYAQGHAYLAGPYKGAPLSLAVITPATAGPYDLGTVVVRNALQVNPETAQISAVSDEIPHILQGIPLDVRSIALNLTRNQFTLNPTSREKMAISGGITSVLNQSSPLSNPFQVGECKKLGFAPKLSLRLKGDTKRGGTPALKATLTYPKGNYANIAKASVALPHSEFLDNAHIQTVCTRVQLAASACPKGSIYGKARAFTPLLDKPLEGPVYLGTGYGHELPDLLADLNGQIHVILNGTIDSIHGGIRNRFEVVPDAPVSKFTLEMQGGSKGLLENSTNLCAKTNRATARFIAQNGKVDNYNPPVIAQGCKKSAKKAAGKKKHHGKG
jgi:hypothetical protein